MDNKMSINFNFEGTFPKKSCDSSIVHKSAQIDTSNKSLNHNLDKASLNFLS